MAVVTWGLLQKSLVDAEKIEEAINRLIAAHNAAESAHLGAGQALQSHKASEIIDHLVASIVADKIKKHEVTLEKLDFDRFLFLTMFESLAPWFQTKTGGRGIIELQGPVVYIVSGNQANDIASIQLIASPLTGNPNDDPYFAVTILCPDMDVYNAYVWVLTDSDIGEDPVYGFGFQLNPTDHKLYAVWGNGLTYQKYDTGVTAFGDFLGLKADYDHVSDVLAFYVNDALVHSVSAPDFTMGNDPMLSIGQKTKAATVGPDMYIYNAVYSRLY